jgi:hypothetical protein
MQLLRRHVLDPEDTRIGQLEGEEHVLAADLGIALEGQVDLEVVPVELLGIDVDLQVDLRSLVLRLQGTRRVGILEREVLAVLGEGIQRRDGIVLRGAVGCR